MKPTFACVVLVTLIASANRCLAQGSSNLPVIRPKVTELGEFRDTTLRALLVPQEAALSPRGTLVAYITRDGELRIWDPSTRASRVVLKGDAESIAWSAAGDAIAFAHQSDDGSQEHVWVLRVNPVTGESIGSAQRVSLTATTGDAAQFSPDGKTIAFPRQDSRAQTSLVVVPAAGGAERVLASGTRICKLRWATDGSAVYYVSFQDSTTTKAALSRIGITGGAPQLVHVFAVETDVPETSADNRVVILPEPTTGAELVSRISEPSGRALGAWSVPAGVSVRDWSGAYRTVGVRETHPRGLRIVNVADGKSRDLIDSTADVQALSWFEDSRRFAALVFYQDTAALVTMNADGSGVRKLRLASRPSRNLNLFAPPVEKLRVSPDGRYAVYLGLGPSDGLGGSSLELVELSTGQGKTLARAREIMQPFWRRDSKTIRYMRITGAPPSDPRWLSVHDVSLDGIDTFVRAFPESQHQRAVVLINHDFVSVFGGTTTALARFDGNPDQVLLHGSTRSPGTLSPDGRTVAALLGSLGSVEPIRKIMLLSASDNSRRTLDLQFATIGCGPFSPDSRYLYCSGREADSGPQTLYEVPIDGSKPRVVSRSDSREIRGAVALSPDGKSMLQTVSGVRRAAFVGLDFTDGMAKLLSSATNP